MIERKALIERFAEKGEKTGWTYVLIPEEVVQELYPGMKKSFRLKGRIDAVVIKQQAILPMGGGEFILPLRADLMKRIKKPVGEYVQLVLEVDRSERALNEDLLLSLQEAPKANKVFTAMPPSHQYYYSNYVNTAKAEATRAKRIAKIIDSLERGLDFGEMMRQKD